MNHGFLLLVAGVAAALGGCVSSTRIAHEDGTWSIVTRNPALLDGCLVMVARYAEGEHPDPVMVGEPHIAVGPSVADQLWNGAAWVWASYRHEQGLRDSGDDIKVAASGGDASAAGGAAISSADVSVNNPPAQPPKKVWP